MSTQLAYSAVIIIWSTTPLAIVWSSEGVGYLFGISARMLLGLLATLVIMRVFGHRLPGHRDALLTYLAGGLGIFMAMSSVYWGAQFIPSGWVSVVFGLSPIVTGLFAAGLLAERALTAPKMVGVTCAMLGLFIIFGQGAVIGQEFLFGVFAVFAGTTFHALSAVLVKKIGASIGGFAVTAGSLLVAVPFLLVTFAIVEGALPTEFPPRAVASMVYLGVIGSAIGFALYFYILQRMPVSKVSLIALITPLLALLLGNILNGEPLGATIFIGAGCIGTGLIIYESEAFFMPVFNNRWTGLRRHD